MNALIYASAVLAVFIVYFAFLRLHSPGPERFYVPKTGIVIPPEVREPRAGTAVTVQYQIVNIKWRINQ